jgi:hypothetical protein
VRWMPIRVVDHEAKGLDTLPVGGEPPNSCVRVPCGLPLPPTDISHPGEIRPDLFGHYAAAKLHSPSGTGKEEGHRGLLHSCRPPPHGQNVGQIFLSRLFRGDVLRGADCMLALLLGVWSPLASALLPPRRLRRVAPRRARRCVSSAKEASAGRTTLSAVADIEAEADGDGVLSSSAALALALSMAFSCRLFPRWNTVVAAKQVVISKFTSPILSR